jgi:hypothetical protein
MAVELHHDEPNDVHVRALYRFDDGTRFAFAHRDQLIRCADGSPWACSSGDRLLSARSGECLAIRIGSVYYDPESREPMYYELPTDRATGP